jgi:hypothetical protein
MFRKYSALVVVLICLASCVRTNNNLPMPSITNGPTEGAESGITIIGTVMNVSLSARVIMLEEPVEDFSVIALTEESALISADGDEITLRDIQPGMTIQAFGQPGESYALLASQVRLLEANPTQPSD